MCWPIWTNHEEREISVMKIKRPWSHPTNGQQLFDESTYFQVDDKTFLHLLDLTILNSWIVLSACRCQYSRRDLRLPSVRNLLQAGHFPNRPSSRRIGRPATNCLCLARSTQVYKVCYRLLTMVYDIWANWLTTVRQPVRPTHCYQCYCLVREKYL
jgi:hypothetical protein